MLFKQTFTFVLIRLDDKVPDENGDEPDGFDETIYPVDFQEYEGTSGQIIDDVRRIHISKIIFRHIC